MIKSRKFLVSITLMYLLLAPEMIPSSGAVPPWFDELHPSCESGFLYTPTEYRVSQYSKVASHVPVPAGFDGAKNPEQELNLLRTRLSDLKNNDPLVLWADKYKRQDCKSEHFQLCGLNSRNDGLFVMQFNVNAAVNLIFIIKTSAGKLKNCLAEMVIWKQQLIANARG